MSQRDHYEVLGVRRDAPPEEIKSAFKRLAALYHPDRNQNDPSAHDRFKEINLAYQVLSDESRRTMYNRFGHKAEAPGSPFSSGGPFPGGFVDISDIAIDGILGDLLGVFGVGRGDKGEKPMRYERIVACGDCSGSGAAAGTTPEPCSACNGKGRVRFQQGIFPIAVERTCSRCNGTGRTVRHACATCRATGLVSSVDTLRVTIPAGVVAGETKLVPAAGNRTRSDRAPGDLEITIKVAEHPFFRREGDDVLCAVPITFVQAALGAEVEVPTLDGRGKVRVPPGTQPGTVLRVKGRGIPHRGGLGRGDQRVEVTVEVPTRLTERQRQLLEDLGRELGEDVQPVRATFMDRLRDIFG